MQPSTSSSRASKIMQMLAKKPDESVTKLRMKNMTDRPDDSRSDLTSMEPPHEEHENVNSSPHNPTPTLHTEAKTYKGSSSDSSSSGSSTTDSSEDNDDLLYDTSYVPNPTNNESDTENDSDENDSDENDQNDLNVPAIAISAITNPGTNNSASTLDSPPKKGRKRKRDEKNWKRNVNKKLRNLGKEYTMHNNEKKNRNERELKPPCTEKCKLQCFSKFTDDERMQIFRSYWELGQLEKQRQFIRNSMEEIQPKYQYIRIGGTRKKRDNNNAFYFRNNNAKVRVCKLFFRNTLDINDRNIRTVQEKRNKVANVLLEEDSRGKHGRQKKIDASLKQGVRNFVEQIPKIESHYTRANTSKLFIDGSKSIADLHKDYIKDCKEKNLPFVNYIMFYRIFTEDFNISFFTPKKDLCETCASYENAEGVEKQELKEYYDRHLIEKELSRGEKRTDKEETDALVAVYDLQAVMQIPKGDVSVFYYKSKLNVLNFTIYNLKTNDCECFVWDESNGHRGINELGTCILQYLKKNASADDQDIIFYSDNCAGQQKNKFMVALYFYAIRHLNNIRSITHKFLIKGHTQNEGDSAHSLIERQVKRQLRGGPMYTPESFVAAIRAAKKTGNPFIVNELSFEDFHDIKALATEIGPLNMSQVKISEIKVLRLERNSPTSLFFKKSYEENFQEVTVIRNKKNISNTITLTRAFHSRPKIADNKKQDLLELVQKNHIPKFYNSFYQHL